VRELINVLERAVILCHGGEIELTDLPQSLTGEAGAHLPSEHFLDYIDPSWLDKPLPELKAYVTEKLERGYIERALSATGGRVGEAAKKAGIHPRGMFDKMKKYGLKKEDFKE
jgi:DNA-binding NtrC family response regulator